MALKSLFRNRTFVGGTCIILLLILILYVSPCDEQQSEVLKHINRLQNGY